MGKSTLCSLIAEKYSNPYIVNEETENPHLEKFYSHLQKNPDGYNPFAFQSQMYFLQKRIENEMMTENQRHVANQ
jgi:deoxyadenosine/deoxycytidine kinase